MRARHSHRRGKRAVFIAAGVIMSAALAAGPGYTVDIRRADDPPPPATPATPAPADPATPETPASPATPARPVPASPVAPRPPVAPAVPSPAAPAEPAGASTFGAYVDYGSRGPRRIQELSEWLGGAQLRVGHTYLPGDRWSNIEGAPDFLESWADWRKEKDDRLFVLNVPMLDRNEEGVGDYAVRSLLRRGAAGEFDEHYRVLARRLVDLGVPDTVLVLGWEMNGTTYTHRCAPDPESWKAYWKRIVTAMRAVPGQKFRFDFTPSRGRDAVPWTECYPGDDVVDIVGMDSYDQPRGMAFDEQVSEPYGLKDHVEFAARHKKAISYPEWGLFRNGDNAEYMRRMLAWMDDKQPLYNTITDYCPHGVWQCSTNPRSSRVYRELLTGRGDTPPKPTEPKPTPTECSPLDLGDWVEYWLGGKLCLRFDWWRRDR
ncbi:glycoside hydrolase family 26 protein [Streptomyces sp. NPDC053474]|uniref:glycoside hydrolase family 26 protein n=1 Tax=Streptomyces sp. NPDC053474 TaxID=3365704 RepID=UPI0037CD47C3